MLKASVNLNRKVTRDYNSTGYGVSIEGEILAPLDDPETVVARIQELFHLAQNALATEIDRDQSEDSIARRDEEPVNRQPGTNPPGPARPTAPAPQPTQPSHPANHHSSKNLSDGVTPKQVQFIQNLAKRQRLSTADLEAIIRDTLGHASTLHQLAKKEAGLVIDALNQTTNGNGHRG